MRKRAFTLVEIMIVVMIIGILLTIAAPNFLNARSLGQQKTCIANLHNLEGAKEQWAMEYHKGNTDKPTQADLIGGVTTGYLKSYPVCPSGGTYDPGQVISRPTCTVATHKLP